MSTSRSGPPSRPRGRPAKISQAQIVAAALELGLDSFSMQGIAVHLGVTSPALYSHVAGREEVIALVNAALLEQMEAFSSDADDWRGWFTEFAVEVSDHLASSAGALLLHPDGPAASVRIGIGERGLQLLLDAGLDAVEAGQAMWLVFRTAITARPGRVADLDRFVDGTASALGPGVVADLPATHGVHVAMLAADRRSTLGFDLDVVLDGIAARIEAASVRTSRRTP